MNLHEVRVQFREMSGRFDLVDQAGADTGAGFFIKGALKFLNSKGIVDKPTGGYKIPLARNKQIVTLPTTARIIRNVWISNQAGVQTLIRIYNLTRDFYVQSAAPLWYMPLYLETIPSSGLISDAVYAEDSAFSVGLKYNVIVVWPIPRQDLIVEIETDLMHEDLINPTDVNYWTTEHPELLIMAIMHQLEIFHRNTQGVNDWLRSMEEYILNIRQELVHEESFQISQMEG